MVPKKVQKRYTYDFKLQAIMMVLEDGGTQKDVANNLGLAPNLLSRWVNQYRDAQQETFLGQGNLKPEDEKLRRLKEQLRRFTQQR